MTTTQNSAAPADVPATAPADVPATAPAPGANPVLRVPPAAPAAAAAYFAASLAFHADVSDVAAAFKVHREQGAELGFQLVDSRSTPGWDQAHVPGAVHLPTALIPEQAEQLLDKALPVVTYCWGPGCNGGARSALALAQLGFQVKEMLGGIEYFGRELPDFTWERTDRVDALRAAAGL
ncbi:rhodanese-like domain-containing protein [Streptomyces sp. NPDC001193]